jgi:hypothetical protein
MAVEGTAVVNAIRAGNAAMLETCSGMTDEHCKLSYGSTLLSMAPSRVFF